MWSCENSLPGFQGAVYLHHGALRPGKTTLLRLILGLEQPDSGRILGQTFPMAAVFQENRLFEDFSALSNVTAVCPRERRSEAARRSDRPRPWGRAFTPPSAP